MFSYLSLFSGAGGLDIGLERSGLNAVALNEIDPVFCQSLQRNKQWEHSDGHCYFSHADIIQENICHLSESFFRGLRKPDLVVGGPPCQAFSSAGKQLSVLDPRGQLIGEFCRAIHVIKPKMFLFENVRGLVTARDSHGNPGGVIRWLITTLEELGYSCRAALLNSADYGAYQRRVRCFILGSRKGEAPPFPEPTHTKRCDLFGQKWNTLREFLSAHADTNSVNHVLPTKQLRELLEGLPCGSGLKSPGRRETTRPGGHWGYRQGTFIADLDLPARTVTGTASQDWIRWDGVLRRLSFSEVAKLQGFPDDWNFCGSKAQRFKQVGNAVPSIFGKLLGKEIVRFLMDFPRTKCRKLDLPSSFAQAINYTARDHERNKASRTRHLHFKTS
jgi:DNA (cytosine-5)-methyltransferase 1